MRSTQEYFSSFFNGLGSLLKGMSITLREFFTPKTTEKYPENRATLKMFDRFRGELTMPHNERNEPCRIGNGNYRRRKKEKGTGAVSV